MWPSWARPVRALPRTSNGILKMSHCVFARIPTRRTYANNYRWQSFYHVESLLQNEVNRKDKMSHKTQKNTQTSDHVFGIPDLASPKATSTSWYLLNMEQHLLWAYFKSLFEFFFLLQPKRSQPICMSVLEVRYCEWQAYVEVAEFT